METTATHSPSASSGAVPKAGIAWNRPPAAIHAMAGTVNVLRRITAK